MRLEPILAPDTLPLALDSIGACIAAAALVPLRDVAGMVRSRRLKRAWSVLTLAVLCGIALLLASVLAKLGKPVDAGDGLTAMLHVVGPSFVLSVAWLSRNTARDMLRIAALEEAAFTDPLTSLANRRRFDLRLTDEVRRARQSGTALSLIMLDIDRFKSINDVHGHPGGDAVIRAVAALIAARARATDTPCRIGGEEFALIVPGLPADAATSVADRLRSAVAAAEIALPEGGTVRTTISLGVATLASGESPDAFAGRADAALYTAKRAGRDRVRLAA